MKTLIEDIGNAWIAYARYPSPNDNAPEQVIADSYDLGWLVEDQPEEAWEAIKYVIHQYSNADLLDGQDTEGRRVVGLLAAGPLEDFLSAYGPDFIEIVELEAESDPRMAWALGGVWQFQMTDEI